jgi:hypothetical protein
MKIVAQLAVGSEMDVCMIAADRSLLKKGIASAFRRSKAAGRDLGQVSCYRRETTYLNAILNVRLLMRSLWLSVEDLQKDLLDPIYWHVHSRCRVSILADVRPVLTSPCSAYCYGVGSTDLLNSQ